MKVLIVRFSAIGDCVMSAWATTALRNALPDAHIVWAVQERCAPVIDTERLVNQAHVFPRARWKRNRWSPLVWREQVVQYTKLRKQGLDVGFDFQGHSKTALCLRLAGCKERFASRATDAFASRLNRPIHLSGQGAHEVEVGFALVRHRFDVVLPEVPFMPRLEKSRDHWRSQLSGTGPVVSIQTGAGEEDKRYPVSHWNEVARGLAAKGCRVVAVGGADDPRISAPGVQDEVGKHSLADSLALVCESQLHLAADTGSGHAAAAYNVPVVSIFGRTDPARFRPWTKAGQVLRVGTDPGNVTPDQVVDAAMNLLEAGSVARAR